MLSQNRYQTTALIIIVTLVAYIPAMRGGFVWNDEEVGSLGKNIVLEENGLYRVWLTSDSVNYWPVTWTSFWLEYQLWGLNPAGYHVVNILIHAACGLLVWRILLRLKIPGAWLAAMIFAVHPVNVESVAWITQRKNTLSLLFFLVAMLWYLRFEDANRLRWFWGAVAAFLLAMLSKGAVVTMPAVLLLCCWWRRGKITRLDVVRSLPFFAIAVAMSGVEIWFQYTQAIGQEIVRDDTFPARLAGAGWVVWFYVYKALLPLKLIFIYPRWDINPANLLSYLPNAALLAVLLLCWRYRGRWGKPVLFALLYFVITLGPVLGFLDIYFMRYSFVADHYQYISIIGLIALVCGAATVLLKRFHEKRPAVVHCLAGVIVIVLGCLTWRQSSAYEDSETLWRDTLRKNPQAWMAYSNLGNILTSQGKLNEAVGNYSKALAIHADAEIHNNLGNVLALLSRPAEAVPHYRAAIQIDPDYAEPHNNLGMVLKGQGHLEDATTQYREALRIAPNHLRALINLGDVLILRKRISEAVTYYEQALTIDPDNSTAHRNLGLALASLGRSGEAIPHLCRALELAPDSARTHYNLGKILKSRGEREAIDHLQHAVRLNPDYADAHFQLALALIDDNQLAESIRHLREALRIKADWLLPMTRLAWLLATHPDAEQRHPTEALRLAECAAELTRHQHVEVLDTLAAAQAAVEQFDQAVITAQAALDLLPTATPDRVRAQLQERLELYRQKLPYHLPASRDNKGDNDNP